MNTIKIPPDLISHKPVVKPPKRRYIHEMRPGEKGYIVPWALKVDLDHHMWLDANFQVHEHPTGTGYVEVIVTEAYLFMINKASLRDYRFLVETFRNYSEEERDSFFPIRFY